MSKRAVSTTGRSWAVLCGVVLAAVIVRGSQGSSIPVQEIWLVHGGNAYRFPAGESTPLAPIPVGEHPKAFVASPDGSLIAIASDGAVDERLAFGTQAQEFWPKPGSHSTVTILRRAKLEIVGQYEVPFRPFFLSFTQDNLALTVGSTGQWSTNASKAIPAAIASLDVSSGKVLQQATLTSWMTTWNDPKRGRTLVIGQSPLPGRKDLPFVYLLFDAKTGVVARASLPAAPAGWALTAHPETQYLQLEGGLVSMNLEQGQQADPIIEGQSASLQAASADRSRYLLLSRTKKVGKVSLVLDGRIVKSVEIKEPMSAFFDRAQRRAFVIGHDETVVLDTDSWAPLSRVPSTGYFSSRLDPEEKVFYWQGLDGKITAYDIEHGTKVAEFATGRGVAKVLGMMAPGLTQIDQGGVMEFGPDGRFLFVFNGLSSGISIVDLAQKTVVAKEPTGSVGRGFVWKTPDGKYLVSCGDSRLLVMDMSSGVVVERQNYERGRCDKQSNRLVALAKDSTSVYATAPFKKLATLPPAQLRWVGGTRFALITKTGVGVYDMDGHLLSQITGAFDPNNISQRDFYVIDRASGQ